MKKVFALSIGLLLFASCEQDTIVSETEGVNVDQSSLTRGNKVDVCHNGRIINVSVNALSGHQGHGDAVDMDGDGYFDIENDCGDIDCDDTNAEVNETCVSSVYNPLTGRTWMDRNLGASQVATSSTDDASYGDLYQWGRGADGHQLRTSNTTTTLSSSDTPGHGEFITPSNRPYDWRSSQNGTLWQGETGMNNPCPTGYRLPTEAELDEERLSWSSQNAAGAFASPLKLPMGGNRYNSNGSLNYVGFYGYYWSSAVDATTSRSLFFYNTNAYMIYSSRANGFSVRCIKE